METISKYELRKEIIDEEVREAIYKETANIKCFSHENYGFRFSNVSKKIRNDEMLGWCYQLCFVLAPFYEKKKETEEQLARMLEEASDKGNDSKSFTK